MIHLKESINFQNDQQFNSLIRKENFILASKAFNMFHSFNFEL